MAATAVATPLTTHLHDPFSPQATSHYATPAEATALLDLLAVDLLIDSKSPAQSLETSLLNDLLAVDIQFDRAESRATSNVITAPSLAEDKKLLLDLLMVDQQVDGARGRTTSGEEHYSTTLALHDPYGKKVYTSIDIVDTSMMMHINGAPGTSKDKEQQVLRDNATMMHLLAMDESIDNTKRYTKLIESDVYTIIGDLYDVDVKVSGAKERKTNVEDLQCLLDVDHLVDGRGNTNNKVGNDNNNEGGGKRSIFSVKEKYTAKIAAANL